MNIQRQVRQECGFGCVICGQIGTDYEHIVPFSQTKGHSADNIVLLCNRHHGEVTRGRLSKKIVAEAKKEPYAKKVGRNAFYMYEASAQRSFRVGSDWVLLNGCERFHVLLHRSTPLVTIDLAEGVPLLSMQLKNSRDETVLLVDRNRILVNAHGIWDVDLRGTRFIVRRKRGEIVLRIDLIQGEIHLSRLKVNVGGVNFSFKERGTSIAYGFDGEAQSTITTRGNLTNATKEFAMFKVGPSEKGKQNIPANIGIALPEDTSPQSEG